MTGWLEAAVAPPPQEVLLAVPVAATAADRRRAVAVVRAAADCPVRTVEAPLTAAIEAGRAIDNARPQLVMDTGAGIVEMALILGGRVGQARSIQYLRVHRPAIRSRGCPST